MGPGFLHAYVVNINLATRAHAIRLACQHGKLVIRKAKTRSGSTVHLLWPPQHAAGAGVGGGI